MSGTDWEEKCRQKNMKMKIILTVKVTVKQITEGCGRFSSFCLQKDTFLGDMGLLLPMESFQYEHTHMHKHGAVSKRECFKKEAAVTF